MQFLGCKVADYRLTELPAGLLTFVDKYLQGSHSCSFTSQIILDDSAAHPALHCITRLQYIDVDLDIYNMMCRGSESNSR